MVFGKKILFISVGVAFLWVICLGLFMYRSSLQLTAGDKLLNPESELLYCKSKGEQLHPGFWQRIDLYKKTIPRSLKETLAVIKVESEFFTYKDTKVHYIYAKPKEFHSNIPVLLLHGQAFSSETWNELGTIRILSALGYYSVAIDLPGFGQTPSIPRLDKSDFIHNLIKILNIKKPVLISPSMSGSYSLSYLLKHSEELRGYIPVSPVNTNILSEASCKSTADNIKMSFDKHCQQVMDYLKTDNLKLNCIKVPTLVVWGERDRGENSAKLCLLPESQGAEIPDGKHPAYLSNPELWHQLLYNFLSTLNETQACL